MAIDTVNETMLCCCGQKYPMSFSIGNHIYIQNFKDGYLLCRRGGEFDIVQLSNLNTGNVFYGYNKVENERNITRKEMERVLDGHKIICPKCKTPFDNVVMKNYSIGNKFTNKEYPDSVYVLAAVDYYEAALININSGLRWRDGYKVESFTSITQKEFDEISYGEEFTQVKD